MEYLILLALVIALISPLFFIYRRHQQKRPVKKALIGNIVSFFSLCILVTIFVMGQNAMAAGTGDTTAVSDGLSTGMGYLSAALAVGLSCIGGGIAVASGASAALGALSENESIFAKALIFVGLAEGVALYGLLIALMIISKL